MSKLFIFLGSVNAFLAVALGAFGAHGLKSKLTTEMLEIYDTAFKYHIIHAIGMILIGIIAHWIAHANLLNWSGWLLFIGILIFSGSLYILSITGMRWLGAVTPIGGLSFLAGWLLLAVFALRNM